MMEETPRIMYVNKMLPNNENVLDQNDKNSLTILNPINYESNEALKSTICCKFERGISNARSRNYESERGKIDSNTNFT